MKKYAVIDFSEIINSLRRTRDKKDLVIASGNFAKVLGINQASFSKIKAQYSLPKEDNHYYFLNSMFLLYKKKREVLSLLDDINNIDDATEDSGSDIDLKKIKAKLVKIQAEKIEFELKIKKQEYVNINDVVDLLERLTNKIKTELLGLLRISQQLLLCENANEIKQLLQKNIDDILQEISNLNVDELTKAED